MGVAHSALALERRLYAGDVIKWDVIRWAGRAGFRRYDLGGVDRAPLDTKAAGIRQFKEKWGGDLAEYATYRWERRDLVTRLRKILKV